MYGDIFTALPGYPGGKRRLIPVLDALLGSGVPKTSWKEMAFADAFLGGGSVALWAKASGFGAVAANDIAERSAVIGRALIANSTVRLTPGDVMALFAEAPCSEGDRPRLLEQVEAPGVADFLAGVRHTLRGMEGTKRDLLTLLVLRVAIRYFPMGLPSASDAKYIANGEFDRVSGPRLQHYLDPGRRLITPGALLKAAAEINAAVLPGRGVVSRLDAFDFLRQTDADIVYLDPPYAGTQSYEKVFELLDEFIGAETLEVSPFSAREAPLDDLLDACRHIPTLILSLNNAVLDEAALVAVVARHRTVRRVLSIPYRHYGSVATAKKNADNREFMVLATREVSS